MIGAAELKEGIQWAWQCIRRDAMAFVAAGEPVDNALSTARALDDKLSDLEEAEANLRAEQDTTPDLAQGLPPE